MTRERDEDAREGSRRRGIFLAGLAVLGALGLAAAIGMLLLLLPLGTSPAERDAVTLRSGSLRKASGRVLYVSGKGRDQAPGTAEAPLRTLGAAAKRVKPGDLVYVRAGVYDERVTFSRSGTPTGPVMFAAYPGEAVTIRRGFRVTGDHVVVRDFTVSPGETDPKAFEQERSGPGGTQLAVGQVLVAGNHDRLERIHYHDAEHAAPGDVPSLLFSDGSNSLARDIDFHDCTPVAFVASAPDKGRFNTISGGTIHHTTDLLLGIDASHATVENLDMHDPGQVDKGPDDGNAADGINLNGSHITIRGCRIHRIFQQAPLQHSDAIQWWNVADDLVIEGNVIGSRGSGGDLGLKDQGHIQWGSENAGKTSQRVTLRNNVFLGTNGSYLLNGSPDQTILGQADDWRIVGNTFACERFFRDDVFAKCRRWVIADNVFIASGDFGRGEGFAIDHNCYVGCPVAGGDGPGSFRVESPGFTRPDVSAATSFGVEADWRPAPGSPLIGAGRPLAGLGRDAAGVPRPSSPSIGAFEPRRP